MEVDCVGGDKERSDNILVKVPALHISDLSFSALTPTFNQTIRADAIKGLIKNLVQVRGR